MSNVSSLPEHPFVACFVDGVPVNALVDTGSMKSFISDRVYNIIDFNCAKLNKSHAQRVCLRFVRASLTRNKSMVKINFILTRRHA